MDQDLEVVLLTKELETWTVDLHQLDIALEAKQQALNWCVPFFPTHNGLFIGGFVA